MEFEPYEIKLDFTLPPAKRLITINSIEYKLGERDYHAADNGDIITLRIHNEWYKFKKIESPRDNAYYWSKILKYAGNIWMGINIGKSINTLIQSYENGSAEQKNEAIADFLWGLAGKGVSIAGKQAIKHFSGQNKIEYGYQGATSGRVLVKRNNPYRLYETRITYS